MKGIAILVKVDEIFNILENQMFRRIAMSIMVISYETDFLKSIVILEKVDEIHNIFKSASHCLLVER